jgi:hypothetical protein
LRHRSCMTSLLCKVYFHWCGAESVLLACQSNNRKQHGSEATRYEIQNRDGMMTYGRHIHEIAGVLDDDNICDVE